MTSPPPLGPFERARVKMWNRLTAEEKTELASACTIEDVWEIVKDIQGKRHELGNMNKIRPYLDGLKRYDDVIKVIVLSNPAILALIWVGVTLLNATALADMVRYQGPIKFLLQVGALTSNGWICS